MIEVAYVIASMMTGGTQTHLLQVFRFIDRSRFRPHLFCLRDGGDLISVARDFDVRVTSLSMRGTLKSPADLAGLVRMTAALRRLRPALLHAYLLRGNFYGAVAARLAGVPAVVTSKRGLHHPAGMAERFAVGTSNRLSTAILGNSPAVLEFTQRVEGVGAGRMVMIPSGIDTARFSRDGDGDTGGDLRRHLNLGDSPVVGAVTTFKPKKGFRMLFEVLALLERRLPAVRLVVAGEEELLGEAAALAADLGIEENLVLLGKRDDIPSVLAACDVFVLPSQSEGMSNALLEAMSMELPAVATAVGGNPAVIEEGRSGYLVGSGDAQAMAERVASLLADEDLRRRVGRAARQRVVENYSAQSMVKQIESLYDRLYGREQRQG